MNKIYKLKKTHELKKDPTGYYQKKKEKLEEVLGRKITEQEFLNYQKMTKGLI